MNTDTNTALILSGEGYALTIAPAAEAQKTELLAQATLITKVHDNDDSAKAQYASRSLAAMRIAVEKCRKEVKEPVNRIGKIIDQTAKDFVGAIEAEEKRITKLVGDHAAEVARLKAEREEEERRLMEEARQARQAEAAAAAQAESTGKISDIIAARQAEEARHAALAERLTASEAVAEAQIADGVRFAWDFEVTNIQALYFSHPELVELTPKRAQILAALKNIEPTGNTDIPGIRAFKKAVVSSR